MSGNFCLETLWSCPRSIHFTLLSWRYYLNLCSLRWLRRLVKNVHKVLSVEFYGMNYQFSNNQDFQYSHIAKFLEFFINTFFCYVIVKKSQQIFHIIFVVNVIMKNLILVGSYKNHISVHLVTIIPS